jgi:hypothetical protein
MTRVLALLVGVFSCGPTPTVMTASPASSTVERLIAIDGPDGSTHHRLTASGQYVPLDDESGYLYRVVSEERVVWDEHDGVVTVDGRPYGVVLDGLSDAEARRAIDALAFPPRLISYKRGGASGERWVGSLARRGPPLVLDLGGRRGPLPSSLATLGERLEALILADVELSAADVALLARLPALRWLDLSGARLPAGALHALARSRLHTLLLRAVPLDDGDLAALARIEHLEELDLSGCGVSTAQLARLRPAARWRRLRLRAATVDVAGLRTLCRGHSLRDLDLSDDELGDAAAALGDCRHLRRLALARAALGPAVVPALRGLGELVDLDVGWTELRAADLASLFALPRLQRLGLDGLDLTAGIESLRAARQLRVISLRAARVDGAISTTLALLGELRVLLLGRADVGDAVVAGIVRLHRLEVLDLFHTRVSDAGGSRLAALRGLRSLDLEGTTVGDATARTIAHLVELRSLSLSKTRVGDRGLAALRPLSRLRRVDLRWLKCVECPLAAVARPELRELNLSGLPVTDAEVARLGGLAHLHELVLFGTRVSDAVLPRLAGTQLRYLHLGGTRVTVEGARALARARPRCHIHLVPGAPGVSAR